MTFVFECRIGEFQLAGAFDEYLMRTVHKNIVNGVVFQKRLKRAKARHFVIEVLIKRMAFFAIENDAHFVECLTGNGHDLCAQIAFSRSFQRAKVQVIEQAFMQLKLDFAQTLFALLFLVDGRCLGRNAAHLAPLDMILFWRGNGCRFLYDRQICLSAGNTFQFWRAGCPTLTAGFLIF